MMVYPSMLISACEKEGIPYPNEEEMKLFEGKNKKKEKQIREKYVRFFIFCNLQLCRPITWGEHWENAKIIAKFPEAKLKTAKLEDFLAAGLRWSN